MSTQQEDYRTCAAVVAKGAAKFAAAEATRRAARAEFRALLKAGKVAEIIPPAYRHPRPITPEIEAKVCTLRAAGKMLRAIAAELGIGASTVSRTLCRAKRKAASLSQ